MINRILGLWWVVAALLAAGAAVAQDSVRVRSGEHDGFSRLVFYLPEARDWRVGREGDGYRLGIDGAAVRFDLDEVFEFIPKTRIAGLDPGTVGLQIDLACACHVAAFTYRPDILVIDVRDGPPPVTARFEAPFVPFGDRPAPAANATTSTVAGKPSGALPGLAELFAAANGRPAPPTPIPPVAPAVPGTGTGALRADMTTRLSAALSQGLLTPGDPADPADEVSVPAATSAPTPEDKATAKTRADTASGFRVSTAFDIAFSSAPANRIAAPQCPPADSFGFLTAGADAASLSRLSAARAALLDGAGVVRPGAVLDLARAYLALGFGAEAQQVLSSYAISDSGAGLLSDIAQVMDTPSAVGPAAAGRLAALVSCDSPAALWALLASGGRDLPDQIDGDAVLRSVSALPLPLRKHLVPPLSSALRQARRPELAEAVRRTLTRAGNEMPAELVLEAARADDARAEASVEASIPVAEDPAAAAVPDAVAVAEQAPLQAEGGPDSAPPQPEMALSAVAAPPTVPAPRPEPDATEPGLGALTDVLDQMAQGRRPIDDERLAEAAALIHESKGSAAGIEAFEAFLPVLTLAARHREALALVRRLGRSGYAPAYDLPGATSMVITDLALRGSAADLLLALAEGGDWLAPATLPPAARHAVAERLLGLGLSAQARLYAPEIGPGASAEARLLLASIALAEGEPMEALARIATLQGSQARRLRADALAAAGAMAEAAQILRTEQDLEAAGDLAWAGADWASAAQLLPPGPRRDLAGLLADTANAEGTADAATGAEPDGDVQADGAPAASVSVGAPVPEPSGYLAQRRDLISGSSRLRETVQRSLSEIPAPGNAPGSGT